MAGVQAGGVIVRSVRHSTGDERTDMCRVDWPLTNHTVTARRVLPFLVGAQVLRRYSCQVLQGEIVFKQTPGWQKLVPNSIRIARRFFVFCLSLSLSLS